MDVGAGSLDMVHGRYGASKVRVGVPSGFFPGLTVTFYDRTLRTKLCDGTISAISIKRQWIAFDAPLPKNVKPGCLILLTSEVN
jgi:hypothetical protein